MQGSENNDKHQTKMEFIFQIGVIVFVLLGTLVKQFSWPFWILGIICAIGWVFYVQRENRKEKKDKSSS